MSRQPYSNINLIHYPDEAADASSVLRTWSLSGESLSIIRYSADHLQRPEFLIFLSTARRMGLNEGEREGEKR